MRIQNIYLSHFQTNERTDGQITEIKKRTDPQHTLWYKMNEQTKNDRESLSAEYIKKEIKDNRSIFENINISTNGLSKLAWTNNHVKKKKSPSARKNRQKNYK